MNKNTTLARNIGLMIALGLLFMGGGAIQTQSADKKIKAKQEQRSKDFAKYLLDDIARAVDVNIDAAEIKKIADVYRNNPTILAKYIDDLTADSVHYARAIIRDADVINQFDKMAGKTITFAEAKKMLENIKESGRAFNRGDNDYAQRLLQREKDLHQSVSTRLAVAKRVAAQSEK